MPHRREDPSGIVLQASLNDAVVEDFGSGRYGATVEGRPVHAPLIHIPEEVCCGHRRLVASQLKKNVSKACREPNFHNPWSDGEQSGRGRDRCRSGKKISATDHGRLLRTPILVG